VEQDASHLSIAPPREFDTRRRNLAHGTNPQVAL
jgi:hypothetical protein